MMLNRLHFPPTLPHSTHILLWRRTGEPTHDLHHQERQLRPSQNVQKKKNVKSFTFPLPTHPHSFVARIPPTFFCGPGVQKHMTGEPTHDLHHQEREPTHDLHHQERPGPHKMFKRKKMLNRLHFPPTLPHSTDILFVAQDRRTNT
ncbi:hypothetical protein TNCV_2796881 [Trichonephila clavipes]|nr:hypothetical protein TNCV_2796881 [Trichonephila clavipes]